MIAAFRANAEANMDRIENETLMDHTLMPGEFYGGVITFEAPAGKATDRKTYRVIIPAGEESHEIRVSQQATN